jgi:hypothetical protein
MTRADYIRSIHTPGDDSTTIANFCEREGFERPSRQAIESALAKSGTRGRPSSRAVCPACGQRTDEVSRLEDVAKSKTGAATVVSPKARSKRKRKISR